MRILSVRVGDLVMSEVATMVVWTLFRSFHFV